MSLSSRSSCSRSQCAHSQQLTHTGPPCPTYLCASHQSLISLQLSSITNEIRTKHVCIQHQPYTQTPSMCFCWCFPSLRTFFPFNQWQPHTACKNSYCHCKAYVLQSLFGVCFGGFFWFEGDFLFNFIWPSACCWISFLMNSLSDGNSVYFGICFSCFQLPSSRDKVLREHGAKQKDLTTEESTFKETVLLYAICEELPDWTIVTSTSKHFPQSRHLLNDITTN